MNKKVGIRHEDKYLMERRSALTPRHVKKLVGHGIEVHVERSKKRVFHENEYKHAGAVITDNLSEIPVIFGVKEIPASWFEEEKTYIFFSHVIKGQPYNMPMLSEMMGKRCNLIDYERIVDDSGRRLIFFGRFAGLAGMINSLWSFGARMKVLGVETPFLRIKQSVNYHSLADAEQAIREVGELIRAQGLPDEMAPFTIGFTGRGNVSKGSQHIANLLPAVEITPAELINLKASGNYSNKLIYKTVFYKDDITEPIEPGKPFSLKEFHQHPENYKNSFQKYLPHLTILMNCMYWDENFPRLVSKDDIEQLYKKGDMKLKVIGDVTCDPDGSIEFTHSAYIKAEDVKRLNEPLEAEFDGIGVTFQLFNDTILVIAPVPGGPSDKLGILAGDKIIKINGEDAFGKKINNEYVMKLLRGKKGTSVDVSILRSGKDELIDFTIVRDKIPINSIDATYMAAPEIGYIKLTRFAKSSVQEFNESLSRLRAQGMKDLILDLRGNTGGYLNIAVDLADQFLSDKKMIVYTEGLRSPKQEFFSTGSGDFLRGKLIVLINESSASASEIVSGAVQDWDRGLVVGRRSFGKGLVQRPFNLPDGAMIRLTTARYYTPSGRCIQKPYEHGETEEYYKDLTKRLESGELVDSNSIELADSLKYFTSNGRVVYGGGGIIPDIFTPIDSTRFSDFYSDLVRKGIFNTYNLNYLEKNRKRVLKEYPNVESFKEKFIVTDEMYADFLDLAKEKNVERKETEKYYYPDNDLKIQIKALIARNLWDTNAYFRLINELDDELNVAVDLMQSGKAFTDLNLH